MANLICTLIGVRGRTIKIYDRKCEIETDVTIGSVITRNATDGIKTIFYADCTGIQFKKSGIAIGYIQFETPSMQMNNKDSNLFSENTFTFEDGKNGITNRLMCDVYSYVVDRIEGYKYNDDDLLTKDLPTSLADMYGQSRPPIKEEIAKDEAEKQKDKELIENEKKIRREEIQRIKEVYESSDNKYKNPEELVMMVSSLASSQQMFDTVVDASYKESEWFDDSFIAELEQIVKNERLYGDMRESILIKLKQYFNI